MRNVLDYSNPIVIKLYLLKLNTSLQTFNALDQVLPQAEPLYQSLLLTLLTLSTVQPSRASILGIRYIIEYSISSIDASTGHSSLPRKL